MKYQGRISQQFHISEDNNNSNRAYYQRNAQWVQNITQNINCVHPSANEHKSIVPKQEKQIYGAMKIGSLIIFFIPLLLIAPLVAYYMAVAKKQQHKFPHPTITDTACHYPQDIEFRLIMAGSGSFVSFMYWILFRWIKYEKQRTQYPGTIYSYIHTISQASVWGFMIAMGTIDGAWYPDLHTESAVFFFVMLFIIVMTQTIVIRDMYLWDPSVITRKSLWIKTILGIYVAVVWVWSLFNLVTHPEGLNDDQNIYIVILEWNSVYVCIVWLLSYYPEWKNLHFSLSEYKKTQEK